MRGRAALPFVVTGVPLIPPREASNPLGLLPARLRPRGTRPRSRSRNRQIDAPAAKLTPAPRHLAKLEEGEIRKNRVFQKEGRLRRARHERCHHDRADGPAARVAFAALLI